MITLNACHTITFNSPKNTVLKILKSPYTYYHAFRIINYIVHTLIWDFELAIIYIRYMYSTCIKEKLNIN